MESIIVKSDTNNKIKYLLLFIICYNLMNVVSRQIKSLKFNFQKKKFFSIFKKINNPWFNILFF